MLGHGAGIDNFSLVTGSQYTVEAIYDDIQSPDIVASPLMMDVCIDRGLFTIIGCCSCSMLFS